jgi:mono/diheme cytochrome c family protein
MRSGTIVVATLAACVGGVAMATLALAQEPPAPAQTPPAPQAAPDPKAVLEGACSSCHGVDFITEHRKTREDWDFTVKVMINRGAELDPDTAALLVDYLAKTYPADPKPADAAKPPA